MNTIDIDMSEKLEWPIPCTLQFMFGCNFESLVLGWLATLSPKIKSPIVFLYLNAFSNNIEIIEDLREYNNAASPLCAWLRKNSHCKTDIKKKCCDLHDKTAAQNVIKYYQSEKKVDLPKNWSIETYTKKKNISTVEFYEYQCPLTGLLEWAIPVMVNGEIAGVFITGQFKGGEDKPPKTPQQIMNALESMGISGVERLTENEIREKLGKVNTIPKQGSRNRTALFEQFISVQDDINREYNEVVAYIVLAIQHQLMDMVWNKRGFYPEVLDIDLRSIQSITPRFRAARTYLVDCMVFLRKLLNLKGATVFRPRSKPDLLDDTKRIQGSVIDEEPEKTQGDTIRYDRELKTAEYSLSVPDSIWEERKVNGHILTIVLEREDCRKALIENVPDDLSNAVLYVFATKGYERYPVAYLLFLPDDLIARDDVWKQQKQRLLEMLEQISTAYLVQWNMVFAEYHRMSYELGNKYLSHELGQLVAGMQTKIMTFEKSLDPLNEMKKKGGLPHQLSILLHNASLFAKDQYAYNRMISAVIKHSFFFTDKLQIRKKYFFPYDEFLYRLIPIYKSENRPYFREIVVPTITFNDQNRPQLHADAEFLEQAINNLMRNATKYSHNCTKIYVDAKLSEDWQNYVFTITNYGLPINDEEIKHLKELGYRAKNAKLKDGTGIGFGLYIVQKCAEVHGGTFKIMTDRLSEYNIPFLQLYIDSTHPQRDPSIADACGKEINRLMHSGVLNEVVSREVPTSPFTLIYYLDHIKDATMKFTCELTIPIS